MQKKELIKMLSIKAKIDGTTTEKLIDTLTEVITTSLQKGVSIQITGFGTFTTRLSEERMCRNPRTGEMVSVPPTAYPVFKVGDTLKAALKEKSVITDMTDEEELDEDDENDFAPEKFVNKNFNQLRIS